MNDLSTLHTFGVAASSLDLLILKSTQNLNELTTVIESGRPLMILGSGSNCVFTEDFQGVVAVNQLSGIAVTETNTSFNINVASGENWHKLVEFCLANNIYGFENLALIPGTVGAAPIQNIGAYGRELNEFVSSVEYVDLLNGKQYSLDAQDCQFGYRDSIFKRPKAKHWFITHVNFTLPKAAYQPETSYGELAALEDPTPQRIFDKVCEIRRKKLPDPSVLGNAGSFFKNPVLSAEAFQSLRQQFPSVPSYPVNQDKIKIPAAWLIDQCGFKGETLGGVRCHHTQPLVLTNIGGARGADVITLARKISTTIKQRFNIDLENEVRLIGRQGLVNL